MPKLKSNRGAAKRLLRTGKGGFKFRRAFRNHILTKKPQKRKLRLRKMSLLHAADTKSAERLLRGG